MVRSMTSRGERPQAPTAPTRRQLQRDPSVAADLVSVVQSSSTRLAAQQRRRALTTSGKAAQLLQGSIGAGRIRTLQEAIKCLPTRVSFTRKKKKACKVFTWKITKRTEVFT